MNDGELLALIRRYELASMGSEVAAGATISTTISPMEAPLTTLEIYRYNSLNAYLARPLGNEIADRSQVVMPVLRDTVEWMMPQLMRIFYGSKSICRFDPENPQDEKQAEVETAVVNHVFLRDNNGFNILYDFFKDALLMCNGYVEVATVEDSEVSEERYTGLTEIELAAILQDQADEKLEIIEQREYVHDLPLPLPQLPPGAQAPAVQTVLQIPCFDIRLRRTAKRKRTCVVCLPPEEMRISPQARDGVEGIPFAMHLTNKPRSDLITEGFDKALVNSLAAGRPNWLEMDALARDVVVDQLSIENPSDFAMQEVELRKVVMRVDYDGDGVAELRRILIGGDKIIENEVIEETPFVSCQGMRMPHRHTGMSLYDLVMDLQIISTELWRAGLDNLKLANNTRVAVDWRNVNLDDLMTSRPGGPIRGNGIPDNWIKTIESPSNLTEQVLPALAYIDQQRSNRTGIGKGTMGLDADELQNVTKGGQLASMSAAALILELIARMLAEGVKGIFCKIHSELMRHQDKPMEFELSGRWIQVDPSSWRRRTKVSVNVGLGSGNREELRVNTQMLAAAQVQLAQMGLVGPKQAYESFKTLCEALGFSNPERFAMDPDSQEYAQHMQQMARQQQLMPPDTPVQVAKIRAQTELIKQQAENQREQGKLQSQILQDRLQMVHEALQSQQQQTHEAVQGHRDREIQLDQNHLQIILKLIPAIAQVLAAEKRDPNELGGDVTAAGAQIS